jgi:Reverse transcriptase (RNA-dependent DNA polymerase)
MPNFQQRRSRLPKDLARAIDSRSPITDPIYEDFNQSDVVHSLEQRYDNTATEASAEEVICDLNKITDMADRIDFVVHQLKAQALAQLWHQRMGHIDPETASKMHKHAEGIPKLSRPTILDNCPTCIDAKMHKSNASTENSRVATQCFQGISLDFSFIVGKSKNSERYTDNLGLNGETCYIHLVDHFSGMVFGKPFQTKAPPLQWLNQWLARYSPDVPNKTVRFDQGGELGRCKAVIELFQNYGYAIELTGADASHQNGCVERSHKTIGNMIRTLLNGANLPRKFWPYAYQHSLFLLNRIIHDGKDDPPLTICSQKKISLQSLRTFGCRVYVRQPGDRPSKLDSNNRVGIFLGYTNTMKNVFWYDETSNTIKIASHVRFDEGMSDLEDPPPNVKILRRAQDGIITTLDDCPIDDPVDISIDSSPFRELQTFTVPTKCDHPTFGFEISECHLRRRAFVSGIHINTSASKVRHLRRKFVGSYIVQIDNTPIYDANDATDAFQALRNNAITNTFDIILAPDKYIPPKDRQEHMQLDIGQIRCITELRNEPASNADLIANIPPDLSDFAETPFPSNDDIRLTIHSLIQTATDTIPATIAEIACKGKFTRTKLKHLATWDLWLAAETKQLDAMHSQGMFGDPCDLPIGALALFAHWNYYMKTDGTRQARNCCDGSIRAAPQLRSQAHTYSSCVEQPCQCLFYALCAALCYYIYCTDVCNAYANADAPSVPTYIYVDAPYADWYYNKFGKRIERGKVLPVLHALQGHPESGRLWEIFINKILLNTFHLRNTTHERNLYSGTFNDHPILVKRQVDDIAVASPCKDTAQAFIIELGKHVQIKGNDLLTTFNGIQVEQSSDYIRVHCTRYIERLVAAHGWDTTIDLPDSPYHNNSQPREPLSASLIQQIDKDIERLWSQLSKVGGEGVSASDGGGVVCLVSNLQYTSSVFLVPREMR